MVKAKITALNRIVYASGLKALGFRSPRSPPAPTVHSSTFLRLLERSAFLYRNRKNVIYLERYVQYTPNWSKYIKEYT